MTNTMQRHNLKTLAAAAGISERTARRIAAAFRSELVALDYDPKKQRIIPIDAEIFLRCKFSGHKRP